MAAHTSFRAAALAALLVALAAPVRAGNAPGLRLTTFDVDATPPVGAHLAYNPCENRGELGLRARGVILTGADRPVVLCAVDWVGIGGGGHDAFRQALADAAGTTAERVAVHTVHQHDAPGCDFTAERLLKDHGITPRRYEGAFHRELLARLADAVRAATDRTRPVTHLGIGVAEVKEVASNRRIMGPDGKAGPMRGSACKDPALRAAPGGLIDPELTLVSFWDGSAPLAVLSYYAVHPQSYYRTGVANPDFPGIARFLRQLAVPEALHIHFNGAGGNVAAGKYNDGAHENRRVLADRLADAMRRAWEATRRVPVGAGEVRWTVAPVALPPGPHLDKAALEARMTSEKDMVVVEDCARKLGWLEFCSSGRRIELACLAMGPIRILHLPGEPFVEYQLAAKAAARPGILAAVAGYGDYAPGYIGTAAAYGEGGYETEPRSSNVAPEVEAALMGGIKKLLAE